MQSPACSIQLVLRGFGRNAVLVPELEELRSTDSKFYVCIFMSWHLLSIYDSPRPRLL